MSAWCQHEACPDSFRRVLDEECSDGKRMKRCWAGRENQREHCGWTDGFLVAYAVLIGEEPYSPEFIKMPRVQVSRGWGGGVRVELVTKLVTL